MSVNVTATIIECLKKPKMSLLNTSNTLDLVLFLVPVPPPWESYGGSLLLFCQYTLMSALGTGIAGVPPRHVSLGWPVATYLESAGQIKFELTYSSTQSIFEWEFFSPKYLPSSTLLDFSDHTITGIFKKYEFPYNHWSQATLSLGIRCLSVAGNSYSRLDLINRPTLVVGSMLMEVNNWAV